MISLLLAGLVAGAGQMPVFAPPRRPWSAPNT